MSPILAGNWHLPESVFRTFSIHTRPFWFLKNWMVEWIQCGFSVRSTGSHVPRGFGALRNGGRGRWLLCSSGSVHRGGRGLWTCNITEFALFIRCNDVDRAVHAAIPFHWWPVPYYRKDPAVIYGVGKGDQCWPYTALTLGHLALLDLSCTISKMAKWC